MAYIGSGISRFNTADELTVTGNAVIDTTTLVVDSTNNRVGVLTASPATALDVTGTVTADGLTVDTDTLHVDSTNNRVGIGTTSPRTVLDLGTNRTLKLRWGTAGSLGELANIAGDYISNNVYPSAESAGTITYTKTTNDAGNVILQDYTDGIRFYTGVTGASGSTGTLNNFQRVKIDSSGNVGIGTAAPATPLEISTTSPVIRSTHSTSGDYLQLFHNGSGAYIDFSADPLIIRGASNAERMRLTAGGNLNIGKTADGIGTAGLSLRGDADVAQFTRSGDAMLELNRLSNDGALIIFYKDSSAVGSIGTGYGVVDIKGGSAGLLMGNSAVLPVNGSGTLTDGSYDIGGGSFRFNDIYATNGTIQTSDQNEKQDIEELTDAEQRVAVAAKGLLRKYRWKDSVAEKGDDARIHFGIIAQDLKAAFEAEGLDAGRYAMFINSEWTDEETGEQKSRMGVRYNQLLAFIIAAI